MPELAGVPLSTGFAVLALVMLQTLGGAILWRTLRRGATPLFEAIGMGFALGTVAATLAAQVSLHFFGDGWGWIVVPLLGAVVWVGSRLRRWSMAPVGMPDRRDWLVMAPSVIVGLMALVPSVLLTPLKFGYVVGDAYQPDTVFQEALAQSLAAWGPQDSSLLVGQPVRYHWLAYAWIGNLTEVAGAGPFVVMTRIFPVVALAAAVVLAAAWARALTRVWWVPGVAALLVAAGGYVGALQGVILTYDSPSTAYAAIVGLALALTITLAVRATSPFVLLVMGLLAFALVGAKASQAVVVACGIAGVAAWGLVTRNIGRVLPSVIASAVGMALGFLAFLAGVAGDETNIGVSGTQEHASTFQGLDPFPGLWGIALGTVALLLAILPRWVGAAWLGKASATAPEAYFAAGLAFAGIATLAILRSGTNAAWFALASTALLAVLSAVGVGIALERVGYSWRTRPWQRDPLVWALMAAIGINGAVFLAFALAAVSGAPVLWRGPVIAWLLALTAAAIIAKNGGLRGRLCLRWAALATVILTIASIGARLNGSLVWTVAHSRVTPAVQDFILLLDPTAQLPDGNVSSTVSSPSDVRSLTIRGASAPVPGEDLRGADDGVARRVTIIQWTPSMNDAAMVLKEQSASTDIVAVSFPNLQPFLPIISERRALLAGLPYSIGYTTASGITAARERASTVDEFLERPDARLAQRLFSAGVRWLWVTPESFDSLARIAPWTETIVDDPDVVLVRLNDPGANSG